MRAQDIIEYVIRPTLKHLNLYSESAENLLVGTAAHESRFEYLHQVKGPAIGLWQMEPGAFKDIFDNYLDYRSELKVKIRNLAAGRFSGTVIPAEEMHGNLNLACAMARLQYYRQSEPLPHKDDIAGLGRYYKKWYNTPAGKATPEDFVEAFNKITA